MAENVQEIKDRAMTLSLLVAIFMIVGKFLAYWLSGSTAVLSDALESLVHIVATGFSAYCVRFASRPPDESHLFGHGKIVTLSIGIEGGLIFVTALYIAVKALMAMYFGPDLHELGIALFLTGAFGVINLFLGTYLVKTGRRLNAPAIIANGKHVLTDMWTSVVVVGGLFLVWVSGVSLLDPIAALLAAAWILYSAMKILKDAIQEMMDEAQPEDTERLVTLLDSLVSKGEIHEYHQLRHRRINGELSIEIHLLFPDNDSVFDAHHEATHVEQVLKESFGQNTRILTHIEPLTHSEAHPEEFEEGIDPLSQL